VTEAFVVYGPATVGSVHPVCASPVDDVVVVEALNEPPSPAKVTVTFGTTFPCESNTRATSGAGSVVPTVAD
jgi:hypothetical protein